MKNNKQRLFEVMQKVNPDFNQETNDDWAIFHVSRGYGKCYMTAMQSHGNTYSECDYRVKYSDPRVLKFSEDKALQIVRNELSYGETWGIVNKRGIQKVFDYGDNYEATKELTLKYKRRD